jgi:uroporphyrinogen decarboxylase
MTPKEIIDRTIAFEPTDRQPVALLSGGSWTLYSNGLNIEKALALPPETVADIIFTHNDSVGVDLIWGPPSFGNLVIRSMGGRLIFRAKGPPDVAEPLIQTAADIEKIDLEKSINDPYLQTMGKITRALVKKAENKYHVAGSLWGPFTMAGLLYGAENLMRGMYRSGDTIRRILGFTGDLFLRFADHFFVENGVTLLSMGDPSASGDMISVKHFGDYVVPVYKKVFGELHKRSIHTCLHICGNIENRLEMMAGAGAGILSLDYKVDLKKARALIGNRIALAGNINPVEVIRQGSPEEVFRAGRQCIADAGKGGGYLLMPGCDIPPSTPVENVRAMVAAAHL